MGASTHNTLFEHIELIFEGMSILDGLQRSETCRHHLFSTLFVTKDGSHLDILVIDEDRRSSEVRTTDN